MKVNWDSTAADYASFRVGFPAEFYDRLAGHAIADRAGMPGRALDLGTGTGTLARGLAARGWRVTGLDISDAMISAARPLDAAAGVCVDYRIGRSEATGLPAATFDLICAGTCWHWFDKPAAAREADRLLRPDGRLVVAAMEFQSEPGNVVESTSQLIRQYNPEWWSSDQLGFRFEWADDMSAAGLAIVDRLQFDVAVPYTHEAWRGRIRASAGVSASLGRARRCLRPQARSAAAHAVPAGAAGRASPRPLHRRAQRILVWPRRWRPRRATAKTYDRPETDR
jgi:SAM-dependent methyltransferase